MDYINDKKGEIGFEKEFKYQAPLFGCYYNKQKDPKITKGRYLNMMKRKKLGQPMMPGEVRRSYDGTLFTKLGNFPIEFKYNSGKLLPHQKKTQESVDKINNSFFVIRKIAWYEHNKVNIGYSIEKRINKRMKKVFVTTKMECLYGWFNGTVGEGDEHVSHFISWDKGV